MTWFGKHFLIYYQSQKKKKNKMPTYTFRNRETEEVFDAYVNLSEYDEYVEANNLERVWHKAPGLVSGVNAKPADGFRDILKVIHKRSGMHSKVNTF